VRIIAELCQNHNGDPDLVRRMVDEAAEAGASHVKLQNIHASTVAFRPQFEAGVEADGRTLAIRRPWRAERDRLSGLELDDDTVVDFVERAKDRGLVPMTTCFTRGEVDQVADQGFSEIKVASYDCASFPLLRELAERFARMVVSTGATFDDEVVHAASILRDRVDLTLLHAVTIYPTPLDELNLARMEWLRTLAPSVGYSDHTLVARDGLIAAKAAMALGADTVERHFTVLAPDETRDGPVSVDPQGLRELVQFGRLSPEERLQSLLADGVDLPALRGSATRTMSETELLNRDYYRGRFMTPRSNGDQRASAMIANWEETPC
jgi:N,N'-diacetyllegionaminate synthase